MVESLRNVMRRMPITGTGHSHLITEQRKCKPTEQARYTTLRVAGQVSAQIKGMNRRTLDGSSKAKQGSQIP